MKNKTDARPAGAVNFKTNCSWCGERETDAEGKVMAAAFNRVPGDVCLLPRATAEAREAAGLGQIIKDEE